MGAHNTGAPTKATRIRLVLQIDQGNLGSARELASAGGAYILDYKESE